jgi:hypothetical protein
VTGHECSWGWSYDTVAGACYWCPCGRALYLPQAPPYNSLAGAVARLRTATRRLGRAARRAWWAL